jgi:hypothetical protein
MNENYYLLFLEEIEYPCFDDCALDLFIRYKKSLENSINTNSVTYVQQPKKDALLFELNETYDTNELNNYIDLDKHKELRNYKYNQMIKFKKACIVINKKQLEQVNSMYEEKKAESVEYRKLYVKNYVNKKVTCDCGLEVVYKNMSRHKTSPKHKLWESNNPDFKPVVEICKTVTIKKLPVKKAIILESEEEEEPDSDPESDDEEEEIKYKPKLLPDIEMEYEGKIYKRKEWYEDVWDRIEHTWKLNGFSVLPNLDEILENKFKNPVLIFA